MLVTWQWKLNIVVTGGTLVSWILQSLLQWLCVPWRAQVITLVTLPFSSCVLSRYTELSEFKETVEGQMIWEVCCKLICKNHVSLKPFSFELTSKVKDPAVWYLYSFTALDISPGLVLGNEGTDQPKLEGRENAECQRIPSPEENQNWLCHL